METRNSRKRTRKDNQLPAGGMPVEGMQLEGLPASG